MLDPILRWLAASEKSIADLIIGIAGLDVVRLCIQRQHTARFAAIVTAPDIMLEIEVQLASSIPAQGAVGINAVTAGPFHRQV